jgi:hypothetical protein
MSISNLAKLALSFLSFPKFSKRVENTVGKGETAHYDQFLLFPQCFQKTCTADMKKPGLVWERVKQQTFHTKVAKV